MRKLGALIAVLALSGISLVTLASPAGAGNTMTVAITKVVVGDVPSGTTFAVTITCTNPAAGPNPITFNAAGAVTSSQNFVLVPTAGTTCTVSETTNGGATTVTYGCQVTGGAATCNGGSQVTNSGGSQVMFTVTNTFVPPDPAAGVATALDAQPATVG